MLESIQDPGNLGTMIRTGEGAGVSGIIMNRTTVDIFNPKTVRSTMGSLYRVPFYITDDLPETIEYAKSNGVSLYAAHLKGKCSYDRPDYTGACGFMIGNEGNGLSDEIADMADTYIRIPMEELWSRLMPQYQPLCSCMNAIVREGFWENNMRIWFKIYTDTHLMRDITIENDSDDTRTHKIFKALEDACLAFDLGKPIWLDSNVSDFKRHGKTRFTKDNFVEDIDFDFLEMHIIEED